MSNVLCMVCLYVWSRPPFKAGCILEVAMSTAAGPAPNFCRVSEDGQTMFVPDPTEHP